MALLANPRATNGQTTVREGDQSSGVSVTFPPFSTVTVSNLSTHITPAITVAGIRLTSQAGGGADGSDGDTLGDPNGGNGNTGGAGGTLTVNFFGGDWNILTHGLDAYGIFSRSSGGSGGDGGDGSGLLASGGNGGTGGRGGGVTVNSSGDIATDGLSAYGIFIESRASTGGHGGTAGGGSAVGGNGGTGGAGGLLTVNNASSIVAHGASSHGLFAQGFGGTGGDGGSAGSGTSSTGGDGGDGGRGSDVAIDNSSAITTEGPDAHGILAFSRGGNAGNGAGAGGPSGFGGDGGAGGRGGNVTVTNNAGIQTQSPTSGDGIVAESIGGSGGDGGGAGGASGIGGTGGSGGNGGTVNIFTSGDVTTGGLLNAYGIFALSRGGSAGNGAGAGGASGIGGDAAGGGAGGLVTVNSGSTIVTSGGSSIGILAQSLGGGGGDGGGAGGPSGIAGDGKNGGGGGSVNVTNDGIITTSGNNSHGISTESRGAGGGNGGGAGGASAIAGNAGRGGNGGNVTVNNGGVISTHGTTAHGIFALSRAGQGGNGGDARGVSAIAGDGGFGGNGGTVTINNTGDILTHSNRALGILAQSLGGSGGDGGAGGGVFGSGGAGSGSGSGGTIRATSSGNILTEGTQSHGFFGQSIGGFGGAGGTASGVVAFGGDSRSSGDGGSVNFAGDGFITTLGARSHAIFGQSIGGGGGSAGTADAVVALGSAGSAGGDGGNILIHNNSLLTASGTNSRGIFVQSIGGGGGDGSIASGLVSIGGSGSGTGNGGRVTVTNNGTISANTHAIFAQSVGGGGGDGGSSVGLITIGGQGGSGGNASRVTVDNSGSLSTVAPDASAIFAQSVGGGGGNGGGSVSVSAFVGFSLGGSGAEGGDGNAVTVYSGAGDIATSGNRAQGIFAQSTGGGGGNAGYSVSVAGGVGVSVNVSVGGDGGKGGDGSIVTVDSASSISTAGDDANGIFAQSIGGGGGNGGFSIALGGSDGIAISISQGGSGGNGGDGRAVNVNSTGALIETLGNGSVGLLAQSVGGGGGNGGFSIAGSGAGVGSGALSLGGTGAGGGASAAVSVQSSSSFTTHGDDAYGIFAQSLGGGGGNGRFSIAASGAGTGSGALSVGGSSGGGSSSKSVTVSSTGSLIETFGEGSTGLFAQSVGGGGGNGGFSIAGAGAGTGSGTVSLGGGGGNGGSADNVLVESSSSIVTHGADAHGLFAQSLGGGGGNGRFSISATGAGTGSGALSVGGFGGSGGNSKSVTVTNTGLLIETMSGGAVGLLAQSIGGGGGNGGFSISGAGAGTGSGSVSLGGSGAGGGDGDAVLVSSGSSIFTHGEDAYGIFAQSIGGGGGNGRFSIAGSGAGTGSGTLNIGGFAADGGDSKTVTVINSGLLIDTIGDGAVGLFAQSLGGGGGNGGFSITGSGAKTGSGSVGVGGFAGGGGDAGAVTVDSGSSITTRGAEASGILAQSVGGGGGNGGFSIAGSGANTGSGSLSIGGTSTNGGGNGQSVTVTNTGALIATSGDSSSGIFAQSVGGGGGNGAFSISGSGAKSGSGTLSVGGSGSGGGDGGIVAVESSGSIVTRGTNSHGILAQSLGGGGGNGRFSIAISGSISNSVSASVGGFGGTGGLGNQVTVVSSGPLIQTFGDSSVGIFAQSLGGGGGNGGFGAAGNLTTSTNSKALTVSVGGKGGSGNKSDAVSVENNSTIITSGEDSGGISAQSIGGGGGNGGGSFLGSLSGNSSKELSISVGGFGGKGGDAGNVKVLNARDIVTASNRSVAIFAQSVGGGGGKGGMAILAEVNAPGTNASSLEIGLSVGGFGGTGGNGGAVSVQTTNTLTTLGEASHGIMAQSVGGGGGAGGASTSFEVDFGASSSSNALNADIGIGGFGGAAGSGSNVIVTSTGRIDTSGRGAYGILAQSIGGGGGFGGDTEIRHIQITGSTSGGGETNVPLSSPLVAAASTNASTNQVSRTINFNASVGIGGFGGSAGDGGQVTVTNFGDLITRGEKALGIFAQSVGGGGGSGGSSTTDTGGGGQSEQMIGVNFSLGGRGTNGGSAAAVDVTSGGTITTLGDGAHGIKAQSIGGGGGSGGASVSTTGTNQIGTNTKLSANVAIGLGGDGGVAGDGGSVVVTNAGRIQTAGNRAYGIFAQSVGGGGGDGGDTKIERRTEKSDGATNSAARGAFTTQAAAASTNSPAGGQTNSWSVNLTVGAGGAGGASGAGGAVTVNNIGNILTLGTNSIGIFAQSVGGGGGTGGSSTTDTGGGKGDRVIGIGVGLGGKGGIGGSGDAVWVANLGTIMTTGDDAHGIMAQSVGGGGGAGGANVSVSEISSPATNTARAATVTVGLGGDGGVAGDGGTVTVTNHGLIETSGQKAYGILAQSIGGGGGFGGTTKVEQKEPEEPAATNSTASAFSLFGVARGAVDTNSPSGTNATSASVTNSWNLNVAIGAGGAGGSAGDGGTVNANNAGNIVTRGQESIGIFAQSVGGGGGAGGSSTSDNSGGAGDRVIGIGVSLGGQGGIGGSGGDVNVTSHGTIVTLGDDGHGIMAQSIGGGGGAGGATVSVTEPIQTVTNTMRSVTLTVGLGGGGGVAGDGGTVTVTNQGLIDTSGQKSFGILAQSIGGGGGFGGTTKAEQKEPETPAMTNTSSFVPSSFSSLSAITSAADTNNPSGTNSVTGQTNSWSLNVNLGGGIGGKGGSAGNGGAVTVENEGNIVTRGLEALGIFAQSVGGGGGSGGSSASENGGGDADRVIGIGVSLGGQGGGGGSGGAVLVRNHGTIVTMGDDAHGIMAQSVGGGGGAGGASLFSEQESESTNTSAFTVNVGVGGDGGVGGNGSNVMVINEGLIETHGKGAFGIFAQSVGGGGGAGGSSTFDPGSNSFLQTITDVQVVVGGSGKASGHGGIVNVTQAGNVTTFGEGAYGVFAQSVGGGGGIGGLRVLGKTGKIALGGEGGAGGDGGDVTVDFTGNITTYGAGTYGIFAQSIGGGGGVAGNVERGVATFGPFGTLTNLGVGLNFGRDGGAGGNGGAVTINSSGTIVTLGEGSSGIFAQSVGGGGGLAGAVGTNFPSLAFQNRAGSAGAKGSGGVVTINHTGDITTLGDNSHGIFIQSAGGEDDGDKINLELIGSIHVFGTNSDAVFLQSVGGRTNGDITLTLANGDVQGGFGGAAAVRLSDGSRNTLNNFNNLSTMGGSVIVGGSGDDTINNDAIVSGSIDLGAGRNAFYNFTAARINSGATLNLGAGNRLLNAGTLAPGGASTVQTTALTGNLLQLGSGSLEIKLASQSVNDLLALSGSATLDGKLSIFSYGGFVPKKRDRFTILTAVQGVSGEFTDFDDPYKGNYAIQLSPIYTADSVVVETLQDSFSQFALTRNQRSVARNLDSFSGLNGGFEDPRGTNLIEFLNAVPGTNLPTAFNLIAPEEFGAMFDMGIASASISGQNLQRRAADLRTGRNGSGSLSLYDPHGQLDFAAREPKGGGDLNPPARMAELTGAEVEAGQGTDNGTGRLAEKRWSFFAAGSGELIDVGSTANAAGYDIKSAGITLGGGWELDHNLVLGITAGYVGRDAGLDNGGQIDVNGGEAGIYATWFDENCYVVAAVGGGYNHYDTRRVTLGGTARGSTDGLEFNGLLAGGYDVKRGRWTFGPTIAVQYTYVGVDGFEETGSMTPLRVRDNEGQSFKSWLGARAALDLPMGATMFRPELRLTWEHEYLDREHAIESSLASGAGSVFQVNSPSLGRDGLGLDVGLNIQCSPRVSAYVFYYGQFLRENYTAHTISAGVNIRF